MYMEMSFQRLQNSIKHALVKHLSVAKVVDVKHYMKSTQEKSPAQIISKQPYYQKRRQ